MKNVSEILNTLFLASEKGPKASSPGEAISASVGSNSDSRSFDDILNRLTTKTSDANLPVAALGPSEGAGAVAQPQGDSSSAFGNGAVSGRGFLDAVGSESKTFSSTLEILEQITGSSKDANGSDDILRESFLSLVVGLEKLLNLVSNLMAMEPSKAENFIVSLSGGKATFLEAKNLLISLETFFSQSSSLGQSQLLEPDAQKNLLAKTFQTIFQNGQNFLGSPPSAKSNTMSGAGTSNISHENEVPQLFFTNSTIIPEDPGTPVQGKEIRRSINPKAFEASSTLGSVSSRLDASSTVAAESSQGSTLGENVRLSDGSSGKNDSLGVSETQAFRDLVQLLIQSKASQLILGGYLQKQTGSSTTDVQKISSHTANFVEPLKTKDSREIILPVQKFDFSKFLPSNSQEKNSGSTIEKNPSQEIKLVSKRQETSAGADAPPILLGLGEPAIEAKAANRLNELVARLNLSSANFDNDPLNLTLPPPGTMNNPLDLGARVIQNLNEAPSSVTTQSYGSQDQNMNKVLKLPNLPNSKLVVASFKAPGIESRTGTNGSNLVVSRVNGETPGSISEHSNLRLNGSFFQETALSDNRDVNLFRPTPFSTVSRNVDKSPLTQALASSRLVIDSENPKTNFASKASRANETGQLMPLKTFDNLAISHSEPSIPEDVQTVSVTDRSSIKNKVQGQEVKMPDNLANAFQSQPSKLGDADHIQDNSIAKSSSSGSEPSRENTNTVDRLNILRQVTDKIAVHASAARITSRLSFQLIPENLGRVTIQVALVDQTVTTRILVANPEVKEVLQHHLVDLKASLSQAGLQIDQLEVHVQGGSSNLLAQYFQYQQEGFGYRLPVETRFLGLSDPEMLENKGILESFALRTSLVDVLI